jgi:predicted permease
MQVFLQDVRYALRVLRKSPGFAITVVLILALGIGANAAIFQLIDAVRLRTLPVKDPGTLAIVHLNRNNWGSGEFENDPYSEFTYPLWLEVQRRQQAFSSIAVWSEQSLNLAKGGEVNWARVNWVSGDFFTVLGVEPFLGQLLSSTDDQPGCAGGVNLSYAFWQRHYGGDASVIGKTLTLQGHPFPILGVTPPSFYGVSVGEHFDIAAPFCATPILDMENSRISGTRSREHFWLGMLGRLKPGWTVKRASTQLATIAPAALAETIPQQYDADAVKHYLAFKLEAVPAANGFSYLREQRSSSLWLLLGLSGLVLLIACANLANLLLTRATGRRGEIALRLALGASRGELVRQLLLESMLLAIAGAICGGLLAATLSRLLVALISTSANTIFLDMPADWRVLGFAAGLAILTTALFSLAPALHTGGTPPGSVLKAGGRGMTAGRERHRLQRILVISQVALSLVLLAGALLFARSLTKLLTLDPGFQQGSVLVVSVDFWRLKLAPELRENFARDLLERIRAVPGVAAAAASMRYPVSGVTSDDAILNERTGESNKTARLEYVSPAYFETMRIPILAGRDFNSTDTATSPKVVIVNQEFVKQQLNASPDPVGNRFRIWEPPGEPRPYYQIVGVVKNSIYNDMHEPLEPVMYFPRTQKKDPDASANYMVRSNGKIAGILSSIKQTIGVNPDIDIQFTSLRTQIRESLVQDELMATLCGFFATLGVILAAIGLYGVISYTVAQRTNEIGIRMAIGAEPGAVLRMVLGEGLVLALAGVGIGLVAAFALTRVLRSMLFGVAPSDSITFVVVPLVLIGVALAACYFPARRAMRIDPMVALHYE